MNKFYKYLLVFLIVFNAFGSDAGEGAASCGACGACATGGGLFLFIIVVIPILIVVLNIALLVWVARDAKARGMDSSVIWMILVMFTGFIGLILYTFSRPQGNVLPCPSCNNKRLEAIVKCPHCGNS